MPSNSFSSVLLLLWLSLLSTPIAVAAFTSSAPFGGRPRTAHQRRPVDAATTITTTTTTTLTMSDEKNNNSPSTFREAEVLGLKFMQEQKYEEALRAFQKGMKLPGSRTDVIRTKSLSGPSPVGGSMGGFESKSSVSLDEFELQAANYNMACAHAQLNQLKDAVKTLEAAFMNGFDNFDTIRSDPDLDAIKALPEFDALMDKYEPKTKGFNPFGLFGGGKK